MPLIDFTLSDARRFYSSMGNPLAAKGLTVANLCVPMGPRGDVVPSADGA